MNSAVQSALYTANDALNSIPCAKYVYDDALYFPIEEARTQVIEAWVALGGALNMDGDLEAPDLATGAFDHVDRQVHDAKDGGA